AHPELVVELFLYVLFVDGLVEARPARTGVELCRGVEQLLSATDAGVNALVFRLVVLTRKSPLGALLASDVILLRRELLPPLCFTLLDLFHFHIISTKKRFRRIARR